MKHHIKCPHHAGGTQTLPQIMGKPRNCIKFVKSRNLYYKSCENPFCKSRALRLNVWWNQRFIWYSHYHHSTKLYAGKNITCLLPSVLLLMLYTQQHRQHRQQQTHDNFQYSFFTIVIFIYILSCNIVYSLSGYLITCHLTFRQIHNLTSPSNPPTQTETSNSHVNEDLRGRGGCKEGEAVPTIWDTPIHDTPCWTNFPKSVRVFLFIFTVVSNNSIACCLQNILQCNYIYLFCLLVWFLVWPNQFKCKPFLKLV